MPWGAMTLAPREVLAAAIWETFWYVYAGGIFTVLAFAVFALALFPVALLVGFDRLRRFVARAAAFTGLLFLWGAPGNAVFTLTLRGRWYHAADPVVDWLPWLPVPWFPLDVVCGGHYLNGAGPGWLLAAWTATAIPVWAATVFTYRWVGRFDW